MTLIESLKAALPTLVVVLTPLLVCPLVFPYSETSQESKCAALIILMAVYWITESLPMPVTALLPIALCPLLGIASSSQMCKAFFGDIIFLLVGGIIVAIAIEECNLHKRLALRTLMVIGVEPRRLMLGIMMTTAFLSMWISNTATTAMMMPITRSLLAKLFSAKKATKKRLVSESENILSDQDIISEDGQSPTEAKNVSYPVKIAYIENRSKPSATNSSPRESIELHKLEELPLPLPVVVNNSDKQQDDQNVQHDLNHHHRKRSNIAEDMSSKHFYDQEQQQNGVNPQAVVQETEKLDNDDNGEDDAILKNLDPQGQATLKAFCLCVCYSANVGGMATLTGTPPNMVLSRVIGDLSKSSLVTFANWLAFSLPVSFLTLIGCYFWMNISVFGVRNTITCRSISTPAEVKWATKAIREEYNKLGKIRFNEVIVLIHFLILVGLWLTRDPGSIDGWAVVFKNRYVTDGSTAVAIAMSLFIFPNVRPNVLFFRRKGDTTVSQSAPSILNWRETSKKFPWGVMFLLGGGFTLSEASKVSGLSKEIANRLMFIRSLPAWAASIVVTSMTSLVTELTSNTVVVMLLLPILKDIAVVLNVHPMYLMLPATLAASLAFMLPVATPPNALVFAYGDLHVIDMVKAGAMLNVFGIAAIVAAVNSWGYAIYDMGTIPDWARPTGAKDVAGNFTISTGIFSNITVTSPTYSNFSNF